VTCGGAGKTRRWRLAIGMVAALSLFTAVTTGWASRGVTPDPVHAGATAVHAQPAAQGSSPTHQLPTKHGWMARERPQTWTPLRVALRVALWVALWVPSHWPASRSQPADIRCRATAASPADRDILTQLCVNRR
jgi:hypothetical protein